MDRGRSPKTRRASATFADVAVALPVWQSYTYGVPTRLAATVRVGSIVRVPVRGRETEGVVVRLGVEPTVAKQRIKNVAAVLTPDYTIPDDLLALAEWISEYYLSPLGETLSTISFFGLSDLKPRTESRLALAEGENVEIESLPLTSERQRDVVRFFLAERNVPRTRAEICRRVQCSPGVVTGLLKKGVLAETSKEIERVDPYSKVGGDGTPHPLTTEQRIAFDAVLPSITKPGFEAFLLHGITGSGKTEVYLQILERVLNAGRQAIVLVPEISLTPQAVERFRSRFGDGIGVYHSHLTRGQKYDLWRRIDSGQVQVLIGARSAVFAPFPDLGLIVVDEEHEHSYKQGDPAPRYHARDVAVWRAHQSGCPVLLGSATPSLESLVNARRPEQGGTGKYTLLEMTQRVGTAVLPEIRLIDMGAHVRDDRHTGLISAPLQEAIATRLERNEQVILFLNRRGFSNFLLCLACKTAVRCEHCDVVMTWHKAIGRLMCHFCGDTRIRPAECPECGTPNPAAMGAGTQRIEEDIHALFPEARLLRIDLDTTRGEHGFLKLWERIEKGHADILLGTQMIAKGLHLERVTLVGVISADHSLFLPDFRAAERAFAQLTQVAGRAGRMERKGEVVIQTFVPHHYAIQRAVAHDASGFWDQELHMREHLRFPPHWRLLLARLSGPDDERVAKRAKRLGALLRDRLARCQDYRGLSVLGPTPCPIARIQDRSRWQLVIRGRAPALMRRLLTEALEKADKDPHRTGVNLTLDMDPMDLL